MYAKRRLMLATVVMLVLLAPSLAAAAAAAPGSALVGVWRATQLVVDGKRIKDGDHKVVTWELKVGGVFVSTTKFPGRFPLIRKGSWKVARGKLELLVEARQRQFAFKVQGKRRQRLELVEDSADKQSRVYRLVRAASPARSGRTKKQP